MGNEASIAVIGCGGIGSRHLQALGKLKHNASIYALDFSGEAIERAAALFEDSKKSTGSPAILIKTNTYSNLPATLDVAIVATRANVRLAAMQALLQGRRVRHLVLEKFLFARREHFAAANDLLRDLSTSAWVNCPRRIYPGYRQIAQELRDARFVNLQVSASARIAPIGTIGIHFADLLDFLCGPGLPAPEIGLHSASVVPGNRQLSDFAGVLEVSYPGKGYLRYEAIADTEAPQLVSIVSNDARYIIEERDLKVHRAAATSSWKFEAKEFAVPMQSALTNLLVENLLANETCDLTPYSASAAIHVGLFDAIIQALRGIENDPFIEELPFT